MQKPMLRRRSVEITNWKAVDGALVDLIRVFSTAVRSSDSRFLKHITNLRLMLVKGREAKQSRFSLTAKQVETLAFALTQTNEPYALTTFRDVTDKE